MIHKTSPANRTAQVRRNSAMVFRSASRRALETAAAVRMKTRNTTRDGAAPSVPFDAKPRRKDAIAE
jgi:hypothetical protein